jgi:hypothetical protein
MSENREDGNSFDFEYDYSKSDEENTATLNMLLRDLSVETGAEGSSLGCDPLDSLKLLDPEELEQHADDLPELHEILSRRKRVPEPQEEEFDYLKFLEASKEPSGSGDSEKSENPAAQEKPEEPDKPVETEQPEETQESSENQSDAEPEEAETEEAANCGTELEETMEENSNETKAQDSLKGDTVELLHIDEDEELTPKEEKAVTGAAIGLLIGIIGAAAVLTFGALLSDHSKK